MSLFDEISSGDHKEIVWDKNGILFRKWNDETGDYFPEQMRIINKTITFTTDNWKTVRTAIGEYHYLDPKTGKILETYGINAETIIGKLILGEQLILSNKNGSMEFNEFGLTIDTQIDGGFGFNINKNGESLFSVDSDGNLVIKGYVYAVGGVFKGDVEANSFSLNKAVVYDDYGYEDENEFTNLAEYRIGIDDAKQTSRNGLSMGVMFPTDGEMGSYNYYIGSGIVFTTTADQAVNYSGTTTVYGGLIDLDGEVTTEYPFTANDKANFKKNVSITGDLTVNGSKSRVIDTNDGTVLLHAYETTTPYFGDIGASVINSNGQDIVPIDYIFKDTINTDVEYSVFLQKEGEGDLWVDEKDPLFFIVKGTPNLKYSWELKAVQKNYESFYLNEKDNSFDDFINSNEDSEIIETFDSIINQLDNEEVWIN